MRSNRVRKISIFGLFLAMSVILHYVESLIPFVPLPGFKLGLANAMGLIVLYYFSRREYVFLGVLRVLLVGLLSIGLFSSGFFISCSGWLLSTIIVIILSICKKFSIYTLSVSSAIFHGIGQVICCSILYGTFSMMMYLPIVILSGVITGFLIAFVSANLIKQMDKSGFKI